ncbi:hypothetical protein BDV19DRAFT_377364 [Aspergillus venezuelensis]
MSLLSFSCALVTGGGGGLGKAIAAYLVSKGKKEVGATDYFVLDTGVVDKIPEFIASITAKYSDLDCLVNNAGVQRPLSVLNDETSEFLAKADQEIDINVRGPMHLTLGLLEHFKNKPNGAVVMNVSSILAFVPFSVINPVYNGTKAWLHFWSMTFRTQLARGGYEKIKVVEIAPPSVGTDLHRYREDPDDNKKHKNPNALAVEEFMEFFSEGLEKGDTVIAPGMSKEIVDLWYKDFGQTYERLSGGQK